MCIFVLAPKENAFNPWVWADTASRSGFFTNTKVPAASRDRWPLLVTAEDAIAWVCGLRIDERAKVTASTQRVLHVRFEWQVDA